MKETKDQGLELVSLAKTPENPNDKTINLLINRIQHVIILKNKGDASLTKLK